MVNGIMFGLPTILLKFSGRNDIRRQLAHLLLSASVLLITGIPPPPVAFTLNE